MGDFINNVSKTDVTTTGNELFYKLYDSSVNDIKYDIENNKYVYTTTSNDEISLYSTSDILNHYFGDNLEKQEIKDKIFTISLYCGIDCITYEGVVIGFGASRNEAESAFANAVNSLTVGDIIKASESIEAQGAINMGAVIGTAGDTNACSTLTTALTSSYYIYHLLQANKGNSGTNGLDSSEYVSAVSSLLGLTNFEISLSGSSILSAYSGFFLEESDALFFGRFVGGYDVNSELEYGNFKFKEWASQFTDCRDEIPWTDAELNISFNSNEFISANPLLYDEKYIQWSAEHNFLSKIINYDFFNSHRDWFIENNYDEIKTATVDSLKDVKSSFTSATTARRVLYDPIILDLDGDGTVDNGIKLTA